MGGEGSASILVSSHTLYDVHTHTMSKDDPSNYTGFSVGDIYGTMHTSSQLSGYKGCIVIAYDGSEYLLAVDNRSKLLQFWNNTGNREMFASDGYGSFKNEDMSKEYKNIKENLEQRYTKQDAHDYAMSYLLDRYNTGLKISKKVKDGNGFKETKTNKDSSNNYQPTKCP
jgi:hypothetical protein